MVMQEFFQGGEGPSLKSSKKEGVQLKLGNLHQK